MPLIGSAEQSFYQMLLDGALAPGKYVTCSPCFRNETEADWLHQKQFMKVELINTFVGDQSLVLNEMIDLAFEFFAKLAGKENLRKIQTLDGLDIELSGIVWYPNHR